MKYHTQLIISFELKILYPASEPSVPHKLAYHLEVDNWVLPNSSNIQCASSYIRVTALYGFLHANIFGASDICWAWYCAWNTVVSYIDMFVSFWRF
jgi:hypothetical protein